MNSDLALQRLAARVVSIAADRAVCGHAESCTGGWIAKALTDIAGSSQWVLEGFVTYSNEARCIRSACEVGARAKAPSARRSRGRWRTAALERAGSQIAVAVTASPGRGRSSRKAGRDRLVGLGGAPRQRVHVTASSGTSAEIARR